MLLALAASGRAQQLPATPAKSAAAAVPDSPKPLAPRQLKEALRLLRADSVGHATRRTGSEAQGMVMDQTISKLERDFYELFYGSFEAPAGLEDFTVVALIVNDTELFELPLMPRADQIEESAVAAVDAAVDFLLQAQSISQQLESGLKMKPEVF